MERLNGGGWGERPRVWSRAWLSMWVACAVTTIVAAFLLRPHAWAVVATVLFGLPEAWSIWKRGDRFPPLTYVTAYYVPRWLTMTLIGGLVGAIGASWLGFERRWFIAALFALHAWALNHFDVTYDSKPF